MAAVPLVKFTNFCARENRLGFVSIHGLWFFWSAALAAIDPHLLFSRFSYWAGGLAAMEFAPPVKRQIGTFAGRPRTGFCATRHGT